MFHRIRDRMGQEYVKVRNGKDEIYYNVRLGLAHSYLIEENSGLPCGIEYDDQTRHDAFHVRPYFDHFKLAVSSYLQGLVKGTEDLSLMEQALRNEPELS